MKKKGNKRKRLIFDSSKSWDLLFWLLLILYELSTWLLWSDFFTFYGKKKTIIIIHFERYIDQLPCRSFLSSESSFAKRVRASSFVPSPSTTSYLPVSKFTLDTGFFNSLFPISTSASKFLPVATSTDEASPVNVSSCSPLHISKKNWFNLINHALSSDNHSSSDVGIYIYINVYTYLNSEIILLAVKRLVKSRNVYIHHVGTGITESINNWSASAVENPTEQSPSRSVCCVEFFFIFRYSCSQGQH